MKKTHLREKVVQNDKKTGGTTKRAQRPNPSRRKCAEGQRRKNDEGIHSRTSGNTYQVGFARTPSEESR